MSPRCDFFSIIKVDTRRHLSTTFLLTAYSNKLKLSNEMLESFAYNLSHDLKNTMSSIISALRIINRKYSQKSKDDEEILSTTIGKANKIARFITDLLNYSRLDARKDLEEIDLEDILSDYDKKIVDINYERLPKIYATKSLLEILFQNLISNALKYCDKDKPRIIISAEDKDTDWLISVKDNGIGICEKDKDKIFQMMYRVKSIKDEYKGTGIGLASCRKIVEIHGGRIWVESTLGEGSTFFFTIPKKIRLITYRVIKIKISSYYQNVYINVTM